MNAPIAESANFYTPAEMLTPANGSTLSGSSQLFQWSAANAPSYYVLYVGTSQGASNIYYNGYITGTSVTATGLPANGSTIYVRLWSNNGQWYYKDYTYTAALSAYVPASMTSPANGSTLSGSSQMFQWSAANTPSYYVLYVGTSQGASNIYCNGYITGTSITATGLPTNGSTIYVRLWSNNGQWYYKDYTYTAASSAYVPASMTSPANGSTLSGSSQLFQWSAANAPSYYVLYVGTSQGASNIYCNGYIIGTSVTATGLPANGATIYVRLWSNNGQWYYKDYTYTAASSPYVPASMTSPAKGSTLSGSNQLFQWSAANAPSYYVLYVGTSQGASNIYCNGYITGTSVTATGLPTNGSTIYVRLWSNNGQWYYTDYTYTAVSSTYVPASMTSPADGSTLSGSSQLFQWSAANAPSYYVLYVGTSQGASNIYCNGYITGTSVTATELPTNGSTIYVRLWSNNGQWFYNDYTFIAASSAYVPASMTSPANGSTLSGSSQIFQWSAANASSYYVLYVGTSQGASNIYCNGYVTGTSVTATGLPTNGSTIYVRLWSNNGQWFYRDFSYTSSSAASALTFISSPAIIAGRRILTDGLANWLITAKPFLSNMDSGLPRTANLTSPKSQGFIWSAPTEQGWRTCAGGRLCAPERQWILGGLVFSGLCESQKAGLCSISEVSS